MRTLAGVAFLLLAATPALAEDACKADVEKLCQGIPPGGGRLMACLKANEAKVSAPCKKHMTEVAAAVKYVGDACLDDVMRFCPGVPRGQGAVARCLARNEAALQPDCREIVHALREKAEDFKKACGPDIERLCKGIPPGQGRILSCLKSREGDLAPACRATFGR
jgi:hypothetical protein